MLHQSGSKAPLACGSIISELDGTADGCGNPTGHVSQYQDYYDLASPRIVDQSKSHYWSSVNVPEGASAATSDADGAVRLALGEDGKPKTVAVWPAFKWSPGATLPRQSTIELVA